ncbi:ATP-binding cassette domain-containing protein [Enterococcus olivae]
MLVLNHVNKSFQSNAVLKEIDLTFEKGVYGLLSPNGAGKTTLMKMITTLLFPTSGEILWEGQNIKELGAVEVRPTLEDAFLYIYRDEVGRDDSTLASF